MASARTLPAVLAVAAFGATGGYVLANAYVTVRFGGSLTHFAPLFLARNVLPIHERAPREFWTAAAILGASVLAALALFALPAVLTATRRFREDAVRARQSGISTDSTGRFMAGGLVFALFGGVVGYVAASAYLTVRFGGSLERIDFGFLARNLLPISRQAPQEFRVAALLVGAGALVPLGMMTMLTLNERLTTFGVTHWQSRREIRRNGFLTEPGHGFVLAKLGAPQTKEPFLVSRDFPHALMIAPTGRGKGVGFVTPNLLLFKGSVVVLDVKGENFENTARHRAAMEDRVIRVAPLDWTGRTHRYNPLQRIHELPHPDQRMLALQKTARLFLQSTESTQGLLQGGIDIFVACGLLAFEQGRPTIGAIYDLATGGGNKQKAYAELACQVTYEPARRMLANLASINDKTLTSYLSVLLTSGLGLWANPAIHAVTSRSDFSFSQIRRKPHAIYFEVPPDDIETLAPLARLFFSDLIASLQSHRPGADEPGKVMIVLDEFDRLGRMPIVAESIKTLRGYGAHLAIVTQSIPALDELYGENVRLSLQAGAGVKLYFTPSDAKTVGEVSATLGKTTRRVISKSRPLGLSPLRARTVSERTEEAPLMSEDQVRRMPLGDVILAIDAQMPIRAQRLVFHEDLILRAVFDAQAGELPYPPALPKAAPALPALPAPEDAGPPALPRPAEPTEPGPGAVAPARDEAEPPAPVRLVPSARRVAVTEARPVSAIQPLEAVVRTEDAVALRQAIRRIEGLLATPDAVLRPRRARTKTRKLVVSARRASIGQAKTVLFIQPSDLSGTPEDEAALRRANAQVIRLEDLVTDEADEADDPPIQEGPDM
ncbi:type IV secretory system conjugative DNA transfer family protein [Rubellimicrobium aerolatum]|uniref:Type IV secretory system conjugative DNA transfer family protein n=1 Tax=Rubellimicrobium aerolatum TaxID=490979 RepID=A0ABW0SDN0_9RHOB|nr:type IV secretory system conjugative DNA transfer family protein [Rubellimicrobium aerolatum]MBP1807670.1 type IV secretion system protein VirD4 [Rubellimicrobium aerolatum]